MRSVVPNWAPPEEANTSREAPDSTADWSTLTVPTTLTEVSSTGSTTERLASIWAARWNTTSGWKRANRSTSSGWRMSAW